MTLSRNYFLNKIFTKMTIITKEKSILELCTELNMNRNLQGSVVT